MAWKKIKNTNNMIIWENSNKKTSFGVKFFPDEDCETAIGRYKKGKYIFTNFKGFKTKKQALAYAKRWMKDHPNG